jgi:hypothetical protein
VRLPWPFRRSTTPSTGAGTTRSVGAGGGAWRRLPPIEGVVERPPLVAPLGPFKAQLAGAQRPPPVLQRLGHERSASAPAGLVAGLARPTRVSRPVADMPLRRLAGRLRHWFAGDSTPSGEPSPTVTEPVAAEQPAAEIIPVTDHDAASAVPLVAGALTGGLRPAAGPASPPSSRPTVSRSVTAPPGNRYTRADATALPLAAGRSVASSTPTEPPPMPVSTSHLPSLERVVGPARRLRLGPPVERAAEITPSESGAEPGMASPLASTTSSGAGPGLPDPASTDAPPPTAASTDATAAARTAASTDATAAARTAAGPTAPPPFVLRRAPVGRQPAEPSPNAPGTTPDPAAASEAPSSSAPRTQSASASRTVQRSATVPAVRPRPPARSSASLPAAIGRTLPLAGERALRPTVIGAARPLQRAVDSSPTTTPRINRGSGVSEAARELGARAFSLGSDVFIPAEAGPLDVGSGRALLAHELTHVRQQSAAGSGSVAAGSTSGREAEAHQAEAWSLSADLSLARRGHTSQTDAAAPPPPTALGSQATIASETGGDAGGQELALEQAFAAAAASTPAGGPALQLAEDGSAPPPAGAGGDTAPAPALGERELQDLLRQLYPRLRTHLASELLVSRERAGLLTDI